MLVKRRIRSMNGHQSHITHRRLENPVAAHFNSENHILEELSIFAIEHTGGIPREEPNCRRAKQSYWNQTLGSLAPEGLNPYP